MSEIEPLELSNSTAKLSISVDGLKTISERMLDIQSDSLKSTQLGFAKIFESYHIPDAVKTVAGFTEGVKQAIPEIDIPIGTIAAMQDLQKTALIAMQTSIPDLSQVGSVIDASMMRFQTISSFLRCLTIYLRPFSSQEAKALNSGSQSSIKPSTRHIRIEVDA